MVAALERDGVTDVELDSTVTNADGTAIAKLNGRYHVSRRDRAGMRRAVAEPAVRASV